MRWTWSASRCRVVDGTRERLSPQVCVILLYRCVCVNMALFYLHSFCCIAREPALQRTSTKSVCRLQRVKACPSSNTTCYPEPKDSPPRCSVLRAQVVSTNTHTHTSPCSIWVFFLIINLYFVCLTVTAVYDVTLNFKDNQTPTLLGIVNGKKYKADMSIR